MIIEGDDLYSFVQKRENQPWIWRALDRETREVVGVSIGNRTREGARNPWNSLPRVDRLNAISYTDFWSSHEPVIPFQRHHPVRKKSGKTNHIERLHCTLRQRLSRPVRKTLSFSKSLENPIGAIGYFLHHYNRMLCIRSL